MMRRRALVVVLTLSAGCGGGESPPVPPEGLPGCPEHEVALPDGSCFRPGVLPEGCAEGFVHDGVYGCEPILPAEPCPLGLMAVPGEDTCRPVMECGAGKWGDLPVDGATQYVDATYAGGDGDGSEAKPWPTIGQAVSAAAPSALIAVAAGTYVENVAIVGKAVHLWGVCPERVVIEATGSATGPCPLSTICIADGADGTEVGGVAARGPGLGITLSGSQSVVVDRVWVHDNDFRGISAEHVLGATAVAVRGSLIELNHGGGLFLSGAEATVDGTVVRATQPSPSDLTLGRGISIQLGSTDTPTGVAYDPAARSTATITRSLIEQNHMTGLQVVGSDVTVDGSVVRTTQPSPADLMHGKGINVQWACTEGAEGQQCDPATGATASVTRSLVEHNHTAGLTFIGSSGTVDSSVIRGNLPRPLDHSGGTGVHIQIGCYQTATEVVCEPASRPSASVVHSLIEQNVETGLSIMGADAAVDTSVVRLTSSSPTGTGRGLLFQTACVVTDTDAACIWDTGATGGVTRSLIEENTSYGVAVTASAATLDGSVVRATALDSVGDLYGDGITVFSLGAAASLGITNVVVADSARAGVASFGATVSLAGTHIRCAAFDLDGEISHGADYDFFDGTANACGCPVADGECKVVSSGLTPPDPLPVVD